MSSNNEQRARGEGSSTQKLSKRQRRALGSNPSTSWQQAPRIKSAGARAKAYLNYAGLADNTTTNNSKIEQLLNPSISLHSPEVKFGKLLGGTDERSRHMAVKMLREYLRARSDFSIYG